VEHSLSLTIIELFSIWIWNSIVSCNTPIKIDIFIIRSYLSSRTQFLCIVHQSYLTIKFSPYQFQITVFLCSKVRRDLRDSSLSVRSRRAQQRAVSTRGTAKISHVRVTSIHRCVRAASLCLLFFYWGAFFCIFMSGSAAYITTCIYFMMKFAIVMSMVKEFDYVDSERR
jgi:hypothetical protein